MEGTTYNLTIQTMIVTGELTDAQKKEIKQTIIGLLEESKDELKSRNQGI